jgi:hypothetical protein
VLLPGFKLVLFVDVGELRLQAELYGGYDAKAAGALGSNESCFIRRSSGFGTVHFFIVECAPGFNSFSGQCQVHHSTDLRLGLKLFSAWSVPSVLAYQRVATCWVFGA